MVSKIRELEAGEAGRLVARRMQEFSDLSRKGNDAWFSELCFCILTANSTAKLGIKIQRELGDRGFLTLSPYKLRRKLRHAGHRFPNARASFIAEARRFSNLKDIIEKFWDAWQAREWLVENVKGVGWKESSHLLRNVGFNDVAILDRHVLSVLHEHGLIRKIPPQLTRRSYLEIEEKLRELAHVLDLTLGELDLYLWYMKTGEVLK